MEVFVILSKKTLKIIGMIGILVLVLFITGISYSESNIDKDSDGDGLSDFQEIHKYFTDPYNKDSDGDGIPDGDWNERRESTYTVRTVIRIIPLESDFNFDDDFQDIRVLERTPDYIELEVIHYPLNTCNDVISENPNWQKDDAQMQEYLRPRPSTDWDPKMRKDLIAALKKDGIDIDKLTDKQVVQQVVPWLLARAKYNSKMFTTFYVYFPNGVPEIYPGLEKLFNSSKGNPRWTVKEEMDHEVLGREMFYNKTHGSCTSTAVYLTTALRAIGIPTRMILTMPAVDANDPQQIEMVKNGISHNRVRKILLDGISGHSNDWMNHTLNEVYVGNRWVRLNYETLGQNILWDNFGLMTHILTFNDQSDAKLAQTWGINCPWVKKSPFFGKNNPYNAISVSDLFGNQCRLQNPDEDLKELKVLGAYWEGDPYLEGLKPKKRNSFFIETYWDRECFSSSLISAFIEKAGPEFELVKDEKTRITARLYEGNSYHTSKGKELCGFWVTIYDKKFGKIERGVTYKLVPKKQDGECKWIIEDDISLIRPK
jgi:transglutaminase-like putative cysteine protease